MVKDDDALKLIQQLKRKLNDLESRERAGEKGLDDIINDLKMKIGKIVSYTQKRANS